MTTPKQNPPARNRGAANYKAFGGAFNEHNYTITGDTQQGDSQATGDAETIARQTVKSVLAETPPTNIDRGIPGAESEHGEPAGHPAGNQRASQPSPMVANLANDSLMSTIVPESNFKPTSEETIVARETYAYLDSIRGLEVTSSDIRDELLGEISKAFTRETLRRDADKKTNHADHPKLVKPKVLDEVTCARILLDRYDIAAISLADGHGAADLTLLGIYCDSGDERGLYTTSDKPIIRLAYALKPSLTAYGAESVVQTVKSMAPVVPKTQDARLIPVANGIFNRETRELMDFDSKYVFLAKSPVRYNPHATNPVIQQPDGTPWDVESWMDDLSDDEGVSELLWEILSAAVRPGERWDQAAFLHSSKGNNGKGTFCALVRNLLGPDGHTSVPIAKFSVQFALSDLIHAKAIVTDENPVGAFSKDLGDFKAVITGDTFMLERKWKNPVSVSFSGMVIQCVNDFPKSRDKSASYTRRQLFIPFKKWFGGDGVERKYIKNDYLKRQDVLEYVLCKVLNMDHTKFSNPPACQELLAQFQRENNPVHDFWFEHEDEFVWDLLPTGFVYQCFLAWFKQTHPSGIPISQNEFTTQLREAASDSEVWDVEGLGKTTRPGQKMAAPEKLIVDYDLKDWMNPSYSGTDWTAKALFSTPKPNYRGLLRRLPGTGNSVPIGALTGVSDLES